MPTLTPDAPVARMTRSAVDIRGWIVEQLARTLNVDPRTIDVDAPLETLGVGSLTAMSLTGDLACWLNRDLPATLMWDYTSIQGIAEGLADADDAAKVRAWPGVINFQPLGHLQPVFFFPGLGGHPVTFTGLASHLGAAQPSFGLTVPGLDGDQRPLASVEDIAAAMVVNLRRVQPFGPYQLAGYSFGGLLAYEAACQLSDNGESVSMLAIYDAFTPKGRVVRPAWQRAALHAYLLATHPRRLQYLRDRIQRRRSVGAAKLVEEENPHENPERGYAGNVNEVTWTNARAAETYRPKPYVGSALLFRATEFERHEIFYKIDPAAGWGVLAAGGVQIFHLDGNHLNMLNADHSPAAAELLRPYLSGARAK